ADRNRSHWSTSKTPSYTKSVSWQHHQSIRGQSYAIDNSLFYSFLNLLIILINPGCWYFHVIGNKNQVQRKY
ncbi:hypothetical protein, partial [Escherichia coli]